VHREDFGSELASGAQLKRCTKCGLTKGIDAFSRNRRHIDGLDLHCRACVRERIRKKKALHLAEGLCVDCGRLRDCHSLNYCSRCLTSRDSTGRSRELRAQVLGAYSGETLSCVCCGEQQRAFLTLDHVNNGGRAHRRRMGNQGVYHELRRNGYPPGFQILCFNCNLARGSYGACPHASEAITNRNAPSAAPVSGSRVCTHCKQGLAESEFYPDRIGPGGLQSRCRTCTRHASLARLRAARRAALIQYSAGDVRCRCCGESEEKFLALDHINGSGPRHPTRRGGGNSFYGWLQKHGFPPGLQVLCHNCNCATGRNRECPHKVTAR
jgi:hypothetical protein